MAANQPFHGYVQTTEHALRLVLAARQGIIPRIHRRLNEKERAAMIKSGAIFVFSTDESSIKRWTDGYLWSPSRIVGNFLVYREVADRQGARGRGRAGSSPEVLGPNVSSVDESSKRSLDQANLKPGGMFKKTITVVVEGCDHHLVAYYTQEDLDNERLPLPSTRQDIMDLDLPPHIFRLNAFRIPPKVSIGKDGNPYLVPEPDSRQRTLTASVSDTPSPPIYPIQDNLEGSGPSFQPSGPLPSSSALDLYSAGYPLESNVQSTSSAHQIRSPRYAASSRYQPSRELSPLPSGSSRWPPPPVPDTYVQPQRSYHRERSSSATEYSSNTSRWHDVLPPPSHSTVHPSSSRSPPRLQARVIRGPQAHPHLPLSLDYETNPSSSISQQPLYNPLPSNTVSYDSQRIRETFRPQQWNYYPHHRPTYPDRGSRDYSLPSTSLVDEPPLPTSSQQPLYQPAPTAYYGEQSSYFNEGSSRTPMPPSPSTSTYSSYSVKTGSYPDASTTFYDPRQESQEVVLQQAQTHTAQPEHSYDVGTNDQPQM